jgi:hypothetical protein
MANYPSQEDTDELDDAKDYLQTIQTEWLETLEDLAKAKEETKSEDLFDIIGYLTFCDQFCTNISLNIKDINAQHQDLDKLRNRFLKSKRELESVENIISDMEDLKNSQQQKMENIDDEYSVLAEEVLRRSEDLIAQAIEEMGRETKTPSLKTQIKQNLDKELFLQELRDSLESYREAREELLSEWTTGAFNQKYPEDFMPEDLGEEEPEMDSILSQLDTLITECDSALLIKDIQD